MYKKECKYEREILISGMFKITRGKKVVVMDKKT